MLIHLLNDELIVTLTLQSFLTDLGHEVVIAHSASGLFENLTRSLQPVDLILSDLRLPDREGIGLIHEIHRRYPGAPIIVMTGYSPTLSPDEAVANGVYAYLRKPVRLSELELLLVRVSERPAYDRDQR